MTIGLPMRTIETPQADSPQDEWLADPLTGYRPGDFLLSSPRGTVLARGSRRVSILPADAHETLARIFEEAGPAVLIAGALPFAPGLAGEFVVARSALRGPQLLARPGEALPSIPTVTLEPEARPGSYPAAVTEALRRFAPDGLQKVVLARSRRAALEAPLDTRDLLGRLIAQNPSAYVFAAPLPGRRTLVGASPELLVRRSGTLAVSNPLAGSIARVADPVLDRECAEALTRSEKDLREHAIVVEMVAEVLSEHCTGLRVPRSPELVRTGSLWHLSTRIEGELRDPATTSLDLAFALHPTPAVCGWPTGEANELIAELEDAGRGFYAGAVGWSNASGDGEWAVSIRCAELGDDELRVYAGAGVVPGSDPLAEFAETEAKLRTILRGMGVETSAQQDGRPSSAEEAAR